ncbi:MAG TPA: RagB/SusD family nutrient uptake outer membrane protein, partial [Sphingobacterium sp.]|nr:RagB/SusD family nutrient uptake outer membrane protein [Sphingobacterium sp.]
MKKFLKFVLILFFIAAFFSSCEKMLAERPTTFMSPENSFDTPEQARTVLDGVYGSLQERGWGAGIYAHHLLEQIATDVTKCFATSTVEGLGDYTFTANNSKIRTYWQYSYELINRANLFIDNIEKVDFDTSIKESYKAEALFLRSLIYFNLVRLYGAVPMPLAPPKSLDPEDIFPERTSPAEIYAQIIEDLEYCETHLPEKNGSYGNVDYKYGHATVGAVQGLLAQIYLYRGSIELRDALGDGKEHFRQSAQYARKVIQSSKYELVPYYPDIFREKGNSEVIFDIHYKSGVGL